MEGLAWDGTGQIRDFGILYGIIRPEMCTFDRLCCTTQAHGKNGLLYCACAIRISVCSNPYRALMSMAGLRKSPLTMRTENLAFKISFDSTQLAGNLPTTSLISPSL